jgi:mRNA interferase MazF
MVIRRGEIWWASLPEPRGSEPGYQRPVVIVQADSFNRSSIRTILAAVISSNLRLADAPGNIMLPRKESHLQKDSVINVSQLITLDKSLLTEKIGKLKPKRLLSLEDGIRLVLSL